MSIRHGLVAAGLAGSDPTRRFVRRAISALALLAATAAVAKEVAAPEPGTLYLHTERYELEDGSYREAQRGLLFVPQDRSRPQAGVLAIVFHRFPARDGADPSTPPIFRLHGGPGFGGIEFDEPVDYEKDLAPYTRFTDVVVVGQRGFAPSRPGTVCEGVKGPTFDPAAPEEERGENLREASRRCREFWKSRGLALEGINVREAAADVADVARVLGYDRITLWGVSFGSHWAMAVLRDHPALVAWALLGGMEGPDHTYDMPSGILDGLRRVAADGDREGPGFGGGAGGDGDGHHRPLGGRRLLLGRRLPPRHGRMAG